MKSNRPTDATPPTPLEIRIRRRDPLALAVANARVRFDRAIRKYPCPLPIEKRVEREAAERRLVATVNAYNAAGKDRLEWMRPAIDPATGPTIDGDAPAADRPLLTYTNIAPEIPP